MLIFQGAQPPKNRGNFYICGRDGIERRTASTLLAHMLFSDIKNEKDLLFRVGADGTMFEGYDGQPVVIWDDCRGRELVKRLGGMDNVCYFFDMQLNKQDARFGTANLINEFNIVNSAQPYGEFMGELWGKYTDEDRKEHKGESKFQVHRKFPFIMNIREEDLHLLMQAAISYDGQ